MDHPISAGTHPGALLPEGMAPRALLRSAAGRAAPPLRPSGGL